MHRTTPATTAPSPAAGSDPGRGPVREELHHLDHIRRVLLENPEIPGASEDEITIQLVRLRDDMRGARTDDRAAIHQQMEHLTALLDQIRKGRQAEHVDPESPYFAHLQIEEEGRKRDIFLGRASRLSNGLRIVDWRNAPISRLFYRYQEGDDYCEEVTSRWREGRVTTRRTVFIQSGRLLRVGTSKEAWVQHGERWVPISRETTRLSGGEGTALRAGRADHSSLGSGSQLRADKHLPDIAALIDPDQFALITAPDSGVIVLRGSAGSGKTTVALHRIAYLAYELGRSFDPSRVLVIVWGRALRDYVMHVLPALGVHGVQVTTWADWARRTTQRHFTSLPLRMADDTPEPVTRVKLHPQVAALLDARIRATPGRPKTPQQAIDDWGDLLTDTEALARAMGDDISGERLERARRWTTEQVTAVHHWTEGDHTVDARLDSEDDALLLRAWQLRVGPLRDRGRKDVRHQHLVLDEVQDFSPVEVQVLLDTCEENRSVTLAGDTRQQISQTSGFSNWKEFLGRIGVAATALSTLEVSYRSTHPITRFAIEALGEDDEPLPRTTRDGPAVELFRFTEHGACVAFLAEELRRLVAREPLANVALLTPDPELSAVYVDGLIRAEVPEVRRIVNQKFAFAPGIDVVEADQVKGLEFDYVIVIEASAAWYPDTSHHRRLLHVAATRAIHQLWLTSVGTPSPILPRLGELAFERIEGRESSA